MGDGNDAGRPDAPGGDDDGDEMEHYKKRLIHQVQQSILRESQQSVSEQQASVIRKPKGQRGRKRKTAQVPLLKLGTGDPTALCKSRETYSASAENVHRQYENVTVTGNAKKHKVSETAHDELHPQGGRHVLPAIVPGLPEIFGTGGGRGRRPNQRYHRRHSMCGYRVGNLEQQPPPPPLVPVGPGSGPGHQPDLGYLRYPDLERDIARVQNPMYPTDVDMIGAIQVLIKSIVQREEMSVENLMVLNKFYCDLRRYHGSERILDTELKDKLQAQMGEVVDYVARNLIGYLDRYSVRYVKEMLSLNLQPHEQFFRRHADDVKQRAKNHVWLRTLVQKLSKPEEFEIPDDLVRLVDLRTLQSNGVDATDETVPDVPTTSGELVQDSAQIPGYYTWQNAKLPMPYLTPSVTITPIPNSSKRAASSRSSSGDAPSTSVAGEEPTEVPTDLSVRGAEDTTVPVKEEVAEDNSAVHYYAQELRKFKKLVKDTNAKVYKEVLKQYRDEDVYVVDEDDVESEKREEAERTRSADADPPQQQPPSGAPYVVQPPNPYDAFAPAAAPPKAVPTTYAPFPNCGHANAAANPSIPGGSPKFQNPPHQHHHYVLPRPPAPPAMEPLLELQRLSGGMGAAQPPQPPSSSGGGSNPELPAAGGRLQFTNFTVPPIVQNLRDAEHFLRFHGNGGTVSMHCANQGGAQQEARNPTGAQQHGAPQVTNVFPSSPEFVVGRLGPGLLELRLGDGTVLHVHPKIFDLMPRGQLFHDRAAHALVLVVDERRTVRRLPRSVTFVEADLYGDVEVYIKEFKDVFRYAPAVFADYFKFVTWHQIYRRNNPITFRMFMRLHNYRHMSFYYNLHIKKLHECMTHCHHPPLLPHGVP